MTTRRPKFSPRYILSPYEYTLHVCDRLDDVRGPHGPAISWSVGKTMTIHYLAMFWMNELKRVFAYRFGEAK